METEKLKDVKRKRKKERSQPGGRRRRGMKGKRSVEDKTRAEEVRTERRREGEQGDERTDR